MAEFDIIDQFLKSTNKPKKELSQINILLSIFKLIGYGVKIPKREIEKQFGLRCSLSQKISFPCLFLEDLISQSDYLPGDLQRILRSFYDKYSKYGLKKEGATKDIVYYWDSISHEEYLLLTNKTIIHRNIFKTETERNKFIESKKTKCEICSGSVRLCIDHWRAFSVYNIDSTDIAVLLCEKCNNIHHNVDASKLIHHYKYNIKFIKKWITIEKSIRDKGYLPNETDAIIQNANIQFVFDYMKSEGIEYINLLKMKI